jgi:hypothetical protein
MFKFQNMHGMLICNIFVALKYLIYRISVAKLVRDRLCYTNFESLSLSCISLKIYCFHGLDVMFSQWYYKVKDVHYVFSSGSIELPAW